MKTIIKFLFYGFLILFFLLVLFGVGYWAMEIKQWPWWISIILIGSCVGIVFGWYAVKKFFIRRNEKKFVQTVINEEQKMADGPEDSGGESGFKDAENQWKESVARLKKSHLRKFGNPLYVLPWFIIMGESRSGKTSAIKNSNLDSALTDVSPATIISGTKNCDWWFLEQAIVLDTAGRYTIPIEEEKDKKEWQSFLTLLSKYRKKEPINGVIVTVASDALLNEDPTELGAKAKSIRQRINQMMRILGAKFPVYLLVTKMDLVNGFTDFCDHIPDQRNWQVMGYANTKDESDCLMVLETCMTTISKQIRNLRSVFVHNRINNFAVTFSNEFMGLKSGLEAYVHSLFGDDIYQATPLFRGLYFSSACRKGRPESEFLKTAGISYDNDQSMDKNKGFFLRSFFSAILPKDRNVFTPLSEFIMWRRTTLTLGVFSLMLIAFAMCGMLLFSYTNNVKALNRFNPEIFQDRTAGVGTTDTLLSLDRQRLEIRKLESNNASWILPRLGLNQSLVLEKSLKQTYAVSVLKKLVEPVDDLFFERVQNISMATPYSDIVDSAVYAIQRINILEQAMAHDDFSDTKVFNKSIRTIFPELDAKIAPTVALKFSDIYYDFLTWQDNREYARGKIEIFQGLLSHIAANSDNFDWLVSSSICTTPDITIFEFLKGYQINQSILSPHHFINGAFTRSGRTEIIKYGSKQFSVN